MLTRPGTRGKYNDGVYAISLPSLGWEGEGEKEEWGEMQIVRGKNPIEWLRWWLAYCSGAVYVSIEMSAWSMCTKYGDAFKELDRMLEIWGHTKYTEAGK